MQRRGVVYGPRKNGFDGKLQLVLVHFLLEKSHRLEKSHSWYFTVSRGLEKNISPKFSHQLWLIFFNQAANVSSRTVTVIRKNVFLLFILMYY